MDVRDMARSAWTRIRSKQQIIRDFAWGEYRGKVSLLKILDITAPLIRSYEGHEVLLADTGYYWLQLAIHGSHAWFTVMFDETGKLIQIYVDVTAGNDAQKENPTFHDLYLDYVVHGSKIYELDRDELEAAYHAAAISQDQYETALAAGERIYEALERNREQIQGFFVNQFHHLKTELDVDGSAWVSRGLHHA